MNSVDANSTDCCWLKIANRCSFMHACIHTGWEDSGDCHIVSPTAPDQRPSSYISACRRGLPCVNVRNINYVTPYFWWAYGRDLIQYDKVTRKKHRAYNEPCWYSLLCNNIVIDHFQWSSLHSFLLSPPSLLRPTLPAASLRLPALVTNVASTKQKRSVAVSFYVHGMTWVSCILIIL